MQPCKLVPGTSSAFFFAPRATQDGTKHDGSLHDLTFGVKVDVHYGGRLAKVPAVHCCTGTHSGGSALQV